MPFPLSTSVAKYSKKINYLISRGGQKLGHAAEDLNRALSYDWKSQITINQVEIRVVGIRRSGNHAIINWICQQAGNDVVFINHVRPGDNPYRSQYESQLCSKRQSKPDDPHFRDIQWWRSEKEGSFSLKDYLMYSYEDQEIENVFKPSYERKHDMYVGRSKERVDLIVLRDPFNLFASRLKTKPREDGLNFSMLNVYSRRYTLPKLWISYAKECLNETSFATGRKVFVNYNRWFSDLSYRKEIAAQLSLDFTDKGYDYVSSSGRGSSFDGFSYLGRARQMDVLNRWRQISDNNVFLDLVRTDALLDYSQKIFGHLEGTQLLF